MAMRVAIVHYHLRPGGVTRVVATAARVLQAAGVAVAVVVGEAPLAEFCAPVRVVKGLGYCRDDAGLTAAELVEALRGAATAALGGPPDLWHFHNHALGKNVLLAAVVAWLAEAGERLVLQLHDLVEDGRAANYALIASCRKLYPVGPGIRYVFLNSRDLERFRHSGLPETAAVLLPNAVGGMRCTDESAKGSWVVYPVRGIRRKNLGEMLLLAALAPTGVRFAVTAAPVAAEGLRIHDAWQEMAREHRLPVEFAVVDRLAPAAGAAATLEAWLAHASQVLTTSVAEGFGFAFLDAVALGKPLVGRKLPHLAADWAAAGLRLGGLYDRILVPAAAVPVAAVEEALRESLVAMYQGYGCKISAAAVAQAQAALSADGWLDFGNLPEECQREIIVRWLAEPGTFELWIETAGKRVAAAAWLAEQLQCDSVPAADLTPWSETTYQRRLLAVYAGVLANEGAGVNYLNAARLLEVCLTPAAFHFLRR